MKKLLASLLLIISLQSFAQDSVNITISVQARDLEYIGSFIFTNNDLENIYDTIKAKFRVQNPPTGNTTVSITGKTSEWFTIANMLNSNETAIKTLCTRRVIDLLTAVNQPYLTGKLTAMDVADADTFQAMRQFGRSKLRRL